jgi:hypothetical protein
MDPKIKLSPTGFNLELYDRMVEAENSYLRDNGWEDHGGGLWSHPGRDAGNVVMKAYNHKHQGHAVNAQKQFDRACLQRVRPQKPVDDGYTAVEVNPIDPFADW